MRLANCFAELFAYVGYFLRFKNFKNVSFEEFQANVQRLLKDAEAAASTHDSGDFELAKFALCAWVDETVLSSDWPEKGKWAKEQLQRNHFQTTEAGEEFFDRLNGLGLHQTEVREVYYLCLVMGFSGRYCHEGDDFMLEQLKSSNLKVLLGSSIGLPSLERTRLFPEAYPAESEAVELKHESFGFSMMSVFLLAGPILLLALMYILFGALLGMRVEDFLL